MDYRCQRAMLESVMCVELPVELAGVYRSVVDFTFMVFSSGSSTHSNTIISLAVSSASHWVESI